MPYEDIREFAQRLEQSGDLIRIRQEVDWNLEAGAIMRRANELEGPAQLFEKVKDYPPGFRLMGSPLATLRRLAIAMELPAEASYSEILDTLMDHFKSPVKPVVVGTGPCKERIDVADDVDLLKFPVPMVHEGDGGRFIGTWNVGVTKDLDSDWVNCGMYRIMVTDRKTGGVALVLPQHGAAMYHKYERSGKPMPYAAFIGGDPVSGMIASMSVPFGTTEWDVMGAVRGEPVKLVKCETVDLYVPAGAEIVLEGEIRPGERAPEGPFGEYPGYEVAGVMLRPVFHVKAVTYRKDPILTVSCIGAPIDDSHVTANLGFAIDIKRSLLEEGLPITGVYIPPESCQSLCVVATKTPYAGIPFRIASRLWSAKGGIFIPRVIVVDEDVEPSNMKEVIHALSVKSHPRRGTTIIDNAYNCQLAPFLPIEHRGIGFGANILHDCTWPKEWKPEHIPKKTSFKTSYPEELQNKVLSLWDEYGFKRETKN
jgi:4-hydroxy-3-polyprenylbenzoate decarboxylase